MNRPGLLLRAGLLGLALVLAVALLGAMELVFWAAGLGDSDASNESSLRYQQLRLPILVPRVRPDGVRVLVPTDGRLPPFQSVLEHKAPGTLRVFVFGESAAAGLGYSPNVTFARHLERLLRRADPGRPVEVINLGMAGLSSTQIRHLVDEVCRRHAPDLVVVYCGNNEFLEIHAQKYWARRQGVLARTAGQLGRTRLFRVASRLVPGRGPPALGRGSLSSADLRLPEGRLIEEIALSPEERRRILDRYQQNLEAMTATSASARVPLLLMTVASNLKWRGREDLPAGWVDQLLGGVEPLTAARYRQAVSALDRRLAQGPGPEQSDLLFRRATAKEALGLFPEAQLDYRAALNSDAHLRRASDDMNDRVRMVGRRAGTLAVDTVALLAARSSHGIIGFEQFYDYVHFTPTGAAAVGAAIYQALVEGKLAPSGGQPDRYLEEEDRRLAAAATDEVAVDRWLGFSFDRGLLADRDLWKYDRMAEALDRRIQADPRDALARAYRGNLHFFEMDGAARAAEDYQRALALDGNLGQVRLNLVRLARERPLTAGP